MTERATARKPAPKAIQAGQGACTECVCVSVSVCLYESSRCALTSLYVDAIRNPRAGKRRRGSSEAVGERIVDEQEGAPRTSTAGKLTLRPPPALWLEAEAQRERKLRKKDEKDEQQRAYNLRSVRKVSHQQVVNPMAFTLENVQEALRSQQPAIFNIDTSIERLKDTYIDLLVSDTRRFRTTTNTTATFRDVWLDINGALRIEEGVHKSEWKVGSGSDIVEKLFQGDSLTRKAWEAVKQLGIDKPVEVMMVSGNSTKILTGIHNNGGLAVGRKTQTVGCHFDDIHNFTFLIYGSKTFLLAPPEKVPLGPGKEPNVNRTVDTSSSDFRKVVIGPGQLVYLPKNWWHEVPFAYSDTYASCSSSSIGMHCTDSRTDSPQSLLFFPDTPAGADNPRGCYDCGDVVRGP